MKVARVRSILWLVTALAAAGAAMAVAGVALLPLESSADAPSQPAARGHAAGTSEQARAVPPLASFAPAWQLPLRRPLVDPPLPAPVATDKPAKPPGLAVRLIGTIVDGQHPRGVFMTGLTLVELKRVGDVVAGARVLAIDSNAAILSYEGETVVLHREKNPFDPSGESYDAAARSNPPGGEPKPPGDGG
jgi:hypothetical protein